METNTPGLFQVQLPQQADCTEAILLGAATNETNATDAITQATQVLVWCTLPNVTTMVAQGLAPVAALPIEGTPGSFVIQVSSGPMTAPVLLHKARGNKLAFISSGTPTVYLTAVT